MGSCRAAPSQYTKWLCDARAPKVGEIFSNPNLAETFRTGFYEGHIAQAIVSDVCQSLCGEMTLDDLKGHKTESVEPITVEYGGLDI
jgi:gamma-glutamyltranspeptidase/glutathione hydrolase